MFLYVLLIRQFILEIVSDWTTETFIAALHRFIATHGYPTLIWGNHGTNFVGVKREMRELQTFSQSLCTKGDIGILS